MKAMHLLFLPVLKAFIAKSVASLTKDQRAARSYVLLFQFSNQAASFLYIT